MGAPSFEVIQIGRVLARSHSIRSIDLGGGTGRNSLHLAGKGFDATLVELDADLCSDAKAAALKFDLNLNVQQCNALKYRGQGDYELVLFLGILHFLEADDAARLIMRYRRITPSGGAHVVTISTDTGEELAGSSLLEQGYLGSISRHSLQQAYKGWELVAYEKYRKVDDHLGVDLDAHSIEKFIYVPDVQHDIARAVRRISLPASGGMDNHQTELFGHLRARQSRKQLTDLFGTPDYCFVERGSNYDLSLRARPNTALELCVAFWGRTKCYFESDILIAFAKYESDAFFIFD